MKKIFAAALLLSVLTMGSAFAYPGHHNSMGYASGTQAPLTEEQSKKLNTLLDEHQKEVAPLHKKMTEKMAELQLAKVTEKRDAAKIINISQELGELHGRLTILQLSFNDTLEKEGLNVFGAHHNRMRGGMMQGCMMQNSMHGGMMRNGGMMHQGPGHQGSMTQGMMHNEMMQNHMQGNGMHNNNMPMGNAQPNQ